MYRNKNAAKAMYEVIDNLNLTTTQGKQLCGVTDRLQPRAKVYRVRDVVRQLKNQKPDVPKEDLLKIMYNGEVFIDQIIAARTNQTAPEADDGAPSERWPLWLVAQEDWGRNSYKFWSKVVKEAVDDYYAWLTPDKEED